MEQLVELWVLLKDNKHRVANIEDLQLLSPVGSILAAWGLAGCWAELARMLKQLRVELWPLLLKELADCLDGGLWAGWAGGLWLVIHGW